MDPSSKLVRYFGVVMDDIAADEFADYSSLDNKPVNEEATKLYHAICRPSTVHKIHGDVDPGLWRAVTAA